MTNPPSDDPEQRESLAQDPQQQEYQGQEYHGQDSSAFYGDDSYSKEPSGFGFIVMVAGLISFAAFGGIVIYNLLLAPRAPRQPILIEAEGATKSVPSDTQVKPEPNSDVGVFRMLRGASREGGRDGNSDGRGNEQSTGSTGSSGGSLSLTAVPTQQAASGVREPGVEPGVEPDVIDSGAKSGTKVESITSTPEQGGERGNSNNIDSDKTSTKVSPDEAVNNSNNSLDSSEDASTKSSNGAGKDEESVASKEAVQGSSTPSAQGSWYVQIAALESRSATDRAWARLHDKLPELLYTQKYIAKETRLASGKRVWRLLLGPQGQGEATALCRALQSRSQSCIVKRLDK